MPTVTATRSAGRKPPWLLEAIVRDVGGYGNGLEMLDEIPYDSFGNVLDETNPLAADRF